MKTLGKVSALTKAPFVTGCVVDNPQAPQGQKTASVVYPSAQCRQPDIIDGFEQ